MRHQLDRPPTLVADVRRTRTRASTRHASALSALDALIRAQSPAAPATSTEMTACPTVVPLHRMEQITHQEQRWRRLESFPGGIGRQTQPSTYCSATTRMHAWGGRQEQQVSALKATRALVSTIRGDSCAKRCARHDDCKDDLRARSNSDGNNSGAGINSASHYS